MGDTRGKRKVHVVYDSAGKVIAVMRSNRLPEAVKAAKRAGGKVDTLRLDEEQPIKQPITFRAPSKPVDWLQPPPIPPQLAEPYTVPVVLSREMARAQNGMLADLNATLYGTVRLDGSETRHR